MAIFTVRAANVVVEVVENMLAKVMQPRDVFVKFPCNISESVDTCIQFLSDNW